MKKIYFSSLFLLLALTAFGQAQIPIPLPAQTGTFSGNVRGYWFTAPTCFTITGLEVPTDANPGNQSIAVMRFDTVPPTFGATTNNFELLFLRQDDPTVGAFSTNIQVETGDVIGILGYRSNVNSYASGAPHASSINGLPITLTRLGMQLSLVTNPPQNLWMEAASSISRTWIYYDTLLTYNLTYNIVGGATVDFSDGSDSTFTSVWDYGDGSPLDTTWNPTHVFPGFSTYNVCSYITNACGTDTVCTTVVICNQNPMADWSASASGLDVTFTDNSDTTVSWLWDFGDGNTDTVQNPIHTYASNGWYTICLTATSACGATDVFCDSVLACVGPMTSFNYIAQGTDTLLFSNTSTNEDAWFWDFGDGNTDTTENPQHIYAASGAYTICLVTTGLCGADSACVVVNVCIEAVSPDFGAAVIGNQVNFTDSSAGGTTYLWDFGDGNTDTVANPQHTYALNGDYLVCLFLWNACGDSSVYCDTISICQAPLVDFSWLPSGGTVSFTNNTTFSGTRIWDFGDGNTDTTLNPVHNYLASGSYIVCLTDSNNCGSNVYCDTVTVLLVAIDDLNENLHFKWVPNPFNGSAKVMVEGDYKSAELFLFDLQGKEVYRTSGKNGETINVNPGSLPAGMYIYQLETESGVKMTGRVIAE